tara:strand:- start:3350 stop:3853 length:504 start_codon:yes stop_codon:yes gene_type:complete
MRSIPKLLACCILFVVSVGTASAELKIVTIRAGALVQASPLFKSGQEKIKTEFEKRKSDLESEAKSLADDAKKFQREADVMSSEARAKTEKELQARKIDFDYNQRKFQEDFQERDRELSEKLTENIKKYVVEVAKERGADLVIQDPVYAAAGIDVTDEVIKRMQSGK